MQCKRRGRTHGNNDDDDGAVMIMHDHWHTECNAIATFCCLRAFRCRTMDEEEEGEEDGGGGVGGGDGCLIIFNYVPTIHYYSRQAQPSSLVLSGVYSTTW